MTVLTERVGIEQVEQRNEVFVVLQECLEAKGWTVETNTSEIGLLEPAVFQNADGVLDERRIILVLGRVLDHQFLLGDQVFEIVHDEGGELVISLELPCSR